MLHRRICTQRFSAAADRETRQNDLSSRVTAFVLTSSAVVLNIAAAYMMGWIARADIAVFYILLGILVVFGLNGLRFAVWGVIHRNYAISKAYPLTSIFFPILAVMEWQRGTVIEIHQWVGVGLITLGVFWITAFANSTRRGSQ